MHLRESKMADGILEKIPQDVIIYLLLKLPVKCLMRFKGISKTWYILLHSTTFTNLHLYRATNTKKEFILFKRSFQEDPFQHKTILSFLFGDDDDYLKPVSPDLDVPYLASTFSSNYDQFIGPCHGLIALMNIVDTVLFYPATRTYRLVPPCPFSVPQGFRRYVDGVGFGFDSITNDYKVVRISEVYNDPPYRDPYTRELRIEVYNTSTDSWREFENVDQELPRIYWAPCSLVFFKGACHWLAIAPRDKMKILYFDMSTEVFHNINMPDTCNSYNGPRYGLVVLNKSLTMIRYPDPNPEYDPAQDLMQIWEMEEYSVYESWSKQYVIRPLSIESPLAVWKDCLMLMQNREGFLISYDLKFDKVKELFLHGCPRSLRAVSYEESLIKIPCGSEHSTLLQKF